MVTGDGGIIFILVLVGGHKYGSIIKALDINFSSQQTELGRQSSSSLKSVL